MKKFIFLPLLILLTVSAFAQKKYSFIADIQPLYKDKYSFTAKLDEKTNTLSFETNAPVTVVELITYTSAEYAANKGTMHENTYTKKGQVYSYDLNKTVLNDKYAYWLKVYWGNNGAPLGEYYFKKINAEIKKSEAPHEDTISTQINNNAQTDLAKLKIKTNIKCDAGRKKIVEVLKDMDGIFAVEVDINTGILKLNYSSDGTSFNDIISTILNNGFDVLDDGRGSGIKKSAHPSANPCKAKTTNK